MAGLSRPMNIHEKNINKSINLNIIGTANITKVADNKIKLYTFPQIMFARQIRNYRETDALLL